MDRGSVSLAASILHSSDPKPSHQARGPWFQQRRHPCSMKLPFDRERMRERNLLDDIDEIEQAARQTPSERLAAGLALSDLAIAMLRGNPDAPVLDRREDLEEKARLWAAPLQASAARYQGCRSVR
jgi:hypothetical protein